jgi:hypothetical protein
MTMYEPNPDVRPTGAEGAEFVEPGSEHDDIEEDGPVDPKARPSGSPPATRAPGDHDEERR